MEMRSAIRNTPRSPSRAPVEGVQSVARTTSILSAFADSESLTLGKLAQATELPKPTVVRIASTLVRCGYLQRTRDGSYELGPALVSAARLVLSRGLPAVARRHLELLADMTKQSVNLAVLDSGGVLYIDAIDSRRGVRMVATIGAREPLHATAVGKAMAAELTEDELDRCLGAEPFVALTGSTITGRRNLERELGRVRARGFAIDEGECVVGARCVGAAIRDVHRVVGAVSVSGSASAIAEADIPRIGATVKEVATNISQALGVNL